MKNHFSKSILYIITLSGSIITIGIIGYFLYEQYQNDQTTIAEKQKQLQQQETQLKKQQQDAAKIQTQQQIQQQQQVASAQQTRDQYLLRDQQIWAQQRQDQLKAQLQAQQQQAQQQQQQAQQQQQQAQQQQQQAQIQQQKDYYIAEAQSNAVVSGLINGYITYYSNPLPSYVDPSVQQVINSDINAFDGITIDGIPVHRVYDQQADIQIEWVKNYGTTLLGEAIYWRHVQVGLGDDCNGVWEPFNGLTVERILWHEMGHSFGFTHSQDPNNIMYATQPVNHVQGISESLLCNDQPLPPKNMQWDQNYQLMTQQERNKIWNLFHNSP